MAQGNKTQVWACTDLRYAPPQIHAAVAAHFQRYCASQGVAITPGMRVLVKPFLQNGRTCDPATRLTSHPLLIEALLQYLHARGAEPVSFVASGFRAVRSGFLAPRAYPLARAVLEADLVINCGNAHPHPVWGLSGAVKNRFNSVLGRQQDYLLECSACRRRQAATIVDVCRLARPHLSFLDLTTIYSPMQPETPYPLGILLAGCDPVALAAARFGAAAANARAGRERPLLAGAQQAAAP